MLNTNDCGYLSGMKKEKRKKKKKEKKKHKTEIFMLDFLDCKKDLWNSDSIFTLE